MATTHAAAFSRERPWSHDEFAALLAQPGVFAVGDPRAFALARVVLDEAELLTIATNPAFQRRGLAKALMRQWHAEAVRRGATTAFLEVAEDNIPALSLYESFGYDEAGRRPAYYARQRRRVDALLMRADLT